MGEKMFIKMFTKKFILSVGLLFMVQVCLAEVDSDLDLTLAGSAVIIHVDSNASNGGDGLSWGTAYNNVQDALAIVVSGDEIWVAQGVYYPDVGGGQVDDDRLASFTLIDGVSIYGGFDGTETQLNQRDPKLNVTVLSGDIEQNDINSDGNNILENRLDLVGLNSYHIVNGYDVDTATLFSGFTVTAGQADGVGSDERHGAGMYCGFGFNGPSISESTFIGHSAEFDGAATYGCSQNVSDSDFINNYSRNGGAIFLRGGYYEGVLFQGNTANGNGGALSKNASPLIIVNSKFIANQALSGNGGAISSVNGVTLENVLFSGNKAMSSGGAIYQSNSSSQLTNVTMTGNLAAATGGAIYIFNATLNLRNSIIWNNHDSTTNTTAASSIAVLSTTYTQTNSLVQNFGTGGVNNLDGDPLFITNTDPATAPTLLGNAHLNVGSPAINQGDNSLVTPLITDLDGNTRILDTTVDMGAYEFSSHTVSVNVTGLGAGSLVLQNNSTNDLTFNNDGTLVFSIPVVYSGEYLVTVFSQPTAPNQECVVSNASGIIDGPNVTVNVVCTTIQYSVGGTLSGLINGTLTLQNNTGNDLQLTSDGIFEFTTPIDDLSNYAVTVKTNPNVPRQTCVVTGGSSGLNDGTGQFAGNDYTDIVVTCTINQYSVGGTLSGLKNGTLTLQNNNDNDLQLSSNGAFDFTTQLDDLSGYAVTVKTNPIMPEQTCLITGGNNGQNDGTGDLSGANYTGIQVSCVALYYVDMNAPIGGNGYSWNTAFNNLQDALFNAVSGDSIWVAQGVYYPDIGGGHVNNNRSASFILKNGVSVYGGFNATETQLNQRNPETNVTILSGDIAQDDGNSDGNNILEDKFGAVGSNSYQVVLGTGISDNSTLFSGFTVTAGKADGSGSRRSGAGMYCGNGTNGPSIRMSTFIGNFARSFGGATYGCSHDVRDTHFINNFTLLSGAINVRGGYYENVLFEGNFAVQKGGAISNSGGTLTLVNSKLIANSANAGGGALHSISAITVKNTLFSGNKSSNSNSDGGGLLLEGALTASLTNVTLTGNLAPLGGAISMISAVTLNLRNSIIWNNHGFQGEPNIDLNGGTYSQINSLVQGFGTTGTGNLDGDPSFILEVNPFTAPTSIGNAHLQVGSIAINSGDNSFVSPLITDLDGNTRIQDTTVDMGAYEFSSHTVSVTVSGLDAGTLVLQNNGGDDLTFSTDGTQVFNIPVANTAEYLVSVFNQPTSPSQICIITNGNGTVNNNITDVSVDCSTAQFNVNVEVSGLNASNSIEVTSNLQSLNFTGSGMQSFTPINDGTSYAVLLTSQPTNPVQTCLITGGNSGDDGSGTLAGSDVQISVDCNTPLTVVDNIYTAFEDITLLANDADGSVAGVNDDGVLVNDSDVDGDTLTVVAPGTFSATGLGGQITLTIDGTFSYVPPADVSGQDVLTFDVTDGLHTVGSSLTIDVLPVNDAPTFSILGNVLSAELHPNIVATTLTISQFAFDVYAGADDENSQTLQFTASIFADSNSILDASGVSISNTGELTLDFTGNIGLAIIRLTLQDDGLQTNGGEDTSVIAEFVVAYSDTLFVDDFEEAQVNKLSSLLDGIKLKSSLNNYPTYDLASDSLSYHGHQLRLNNVEMTPKMIKVIQLWIDEILQATDGR